LIETNALSLRQTTTTWCFGRQELTLLLVNSEQSFWISPLTAADTAVSLRTEIQLSSRTLVHLNYDPRPDYSGL